MRLMIARHPSPVGEMLAVFDADDALRALDFATHEARLRQLLQRHYGAVTLEPASAPQTVADALDAYFAGDAAPLAALPTATGGGAFQRQVWTELRRIPFGQTISYGELARRIGRPTASRAVGLANGANPIAIAVPCHRVIGASGKLTGYGGGLERKAWLLKHEGAGDFSVAAT